MTRMNDLNLLVDGEAGPLLFMIWSRPGWIRFLAGERQRVNQIKADIFWFFFVAAQPKKNPAGRAWRRDSDNSLPLCLCLL